MKYRTWGKIGVVVACLLVTAVQAATPASVSADGIATIRLVPAELNLALDENSAMEIRIEDVSNLYGYQMMIEFDPALVAVEDADTRTEDIQVEPGNFVSPDWILENEVDVENGVIRLAVCSRVPSGPVDGDGVLATVTWKGLAAGTSDITLSGVILATPRGESIPVQWESAQVTIGGVSPAVVTPLPATEEPDEANNESPDDAGPDATPPADQEQPSSQDDEDAGDEDEVEQGTNPTPVQGAPDEEMAISPPTPEPTGPDTAPTDLPPDDEAAQQETAQQDSAAAEGTTEQEAGESAGGTTEVEEDESGEADSPQEEEPEGEGSLNSSSLWVVAALLAVLGIVVIGGAATYLKDRE